ncbi:MULTISPECIES: zinc-dependent metalloprotease [Sanguibacteroides]|uniref:DUF5117 domain-containing protein n=2 Tax=Sanguibacteroides justesenii TaxID=1547597 RepID=A0A0C3R461_9PORP|nr:MULTISPECIES: zinc-dependent metalloprotease [Sanguibacteroides]KIO44140.1 hypothetical protein BA92_12250 [Sanguibacteroides justesenii]
MKNNTIIILLVVLLMPFLAEAQKKKGKKGKGEVEQEVKAPKKESAYDKLFKDKAHESAKGLMTVHKIDGKVYFEVPLNLLGKEMLIGSAIAENSSSLFGAVGEKPHEPLHVVFTRTDSLLNLREANSLHTTDNERMRQNVELSAIQAVIKNFEIKAYSPDSTAVVIDMTDFLTNENEKLDPFSPWMPILMEYWRDARLEKEFQQAHTQIGKISAFENNVNVQTSFTYTVSINADNWYWLYKMPYTATMSRTFLLLPEKPMRSRIADPRIGIFFGGKYLYSDKERGVEVVYDANRWRLEPKDVEAYKRGELVEPIKPIVFYVDDNFPAAWKEYVKAGVEEWQAAFEKIGFKNAIIAKDFPKDDPDFDPENLNYSCVRYSPSSVANAMGPSWTDPRSGEILQANVSVYHNLIQLVQDWRFLQTSPADPSVRKIQLDDATVGDCIRYVIAHEIGHCLGLMHNMAASAAIPTDSLRSPSFTRKYGTTYSIMDYARNNYVAQPGDAARGVKMTPPNLGLYDYYAIKWLYTFLPDAQTAKDELPTLERWISDKSGDPIYRYGKQQIWAHYDPSSFEEDLGDDAIKSATYGVKNLKYVLAHLNEWTAGEDLDYSFRERMYNEIVYQYVRYLNHVAANIGGIYLNESYQGDKRPNYAFVPREKQKRALRFLLNQIKDAGWLENPDFQKEMPLMGNISRELEDKIMSGILGRLGAVSYCAEKAPANQVYTSSDYLNDLYDFIFTPTKQGKTLSNVEKKMQLALLSQVIGGANVEKDAKGGKGRVRMIVEVPESVRAKSLKYYGQVMGNRGLADKQGFSYYVDIQMGNADVAPYYYDLMKKTLNLLKNQAMTGSSDTRLHYKLLIHKLEQALN